MPFRRRHFQMLFFNENVWIPIKISLKFVPKDPINNIPALVQIMAWRRPGDKPLTESMMVCLPTHTFVTRPHWVKLSVIQGRWAHDPLPVITKKMAFKCGKSNPITIKYVSSAPSNLVVSYVFHLYWNDTSVWHGEYVSGHGTVAFLLPGFGIIWWQNQVTRQPQFRDLTHIMTRAHLRYKRDY